MFTQNGSEHKEQTLKSDIFSECFLKGIKVSLVIISVMVPSPYHFVTVNFMFITQTTNFFGTPSNRYIIEMFMCFMAFNRKW